MTETVVVEGQVKFRDGKKWKTRWVTFQKPSPVADCLKLLVYKEKKKRRKSNGHKQRLNVTLEGICGVEPGPGYDGVSYTLSILCLAHTLVLGFKSRDALLSWDARICYSLGEVHRFSVGVEPGTKVQSGPAFLHLCNNLLSLSRGLPPVVIGNWKLSALRRYGAVPNGFVFEGGTRCGFWAGVFFLSCSEGDRISFLFDCIVRGVSPSGAPHGLRPNPPADPNAELNSDEERINQETSELEKRLSMLSQCSLASSSASGYSCRTSVAGDDSSISSSSSSQSDTSFGSRLPFWVEPSRQHLSSETASSSSTLKALTRSDDRLFAAVMSRPSSVQLRPRRLYDSGRQSSLDSGIGTAAGSQSSYSGSSSSCTGSLDMASQGGGEDFGSVVSFPPPPPTPPPSPVQHSCADVHSSRCVSQACRRHSEEYQIPSLIRLWYDTPRSLLRALSPRQPLKHKTPLELNTKRESREDGGGQLLTATQLSHSCGSDGSSTPKPGTKEISCHHGVYSRGTAEQWMSVRSRCSTQAPTSSSSFTSAAHERCGDTVDIGSVLKGLKRMLPSSPPLAPPPPPVSVNIHRPTSERGAAVFQPCASRANYVNISTNQPVAAATELLYAELDLQENGAPTSRPCCTPRGDDLQIHRAKEEPTRNAHLNITAMETAHRVGAEHVQSRDDRLVQVESRRTSN